MQLGNGDNNQCPPSLGFLSPSTSSYFFQSCQQSSYFFASGKKETTAAFCLSPWGEGIRERERERERGQSQFGEFLVNQPRFPPLSSFLSTWEEGRETVLYMEKVTKKIKKIFSSTLLLHSLIQVRIYTLGTS